LNQSLPSPITPFYWSETLRNPVGLYCGGIQLQSGDHPVRGRGVVELDWDPSPAVWCRYWSDQADVGMLSRILNTGEVSGGILTAQDLLDLSGMPSRQVTDLPSRPPDARFWGASQMNPLEVGAAREVTHLIVNIINFTNIPGTLISDGTAIWPGRLTMHSDEWTVVMDAPKDLQGVIKDLRSTGGYAFTHVAEIRRTSGSHFKLREVPRILELLRHFLSFVNGSRVGWALPVGFYPSSEPVWSEWSVRGCDAWAGHLTWHDEHVGAAQVSELFPNFVSLWSDEFWQPLIWRTINYYLDCNEGYIEKRLVMAFSALEMLAWAVLVEGEGWLREDELDRPRASSLVRLLLKWAGIPSDIPTELTALDDFANAASGGSNTPIDGPSVGALVRNRIVHPRRDQTMDSDIVVESWLLTSWYLELILLRVLRYRGHYASRLIRGRFVGTTEPVPWTA
jgi:hypothetical protein